MGDFFITFIGCGIPRSLAFGSPIFAFSLSIPVSCLSCNGMLPLMLVCAMSCNGNIMRIRDTNFA